VGQHYYNWRYGAAFPTASGLTAPTPAPNPSGDGFVAISGDQFLYAGAPITLKGTNWWKHTSPFAGSWSDWDGPLALQELEKAKELGVNTIRVGVPYDDVPLVLWDCTTLRDCSYKGVSPWIINEMNQLLQIASVDGMKVIFSIFDWTDTFPVPGSHDAAIQNTYLQGIITPFAGDDRVLGWDIHNEPENYGTWMNDPSKVIAWAQQTTAQIHALDQRHPVSIGMAHAASLWQPGQNGLTLLDVVDFASFHSYDSGSLDADITAIRAHTGKPILLEEMGWPSGPSSKSSPNAIYDENRQTYLYTEMLRVANAQHIAGVVQYTLWDFPPGLTTGYKGPSTEENFGLVRVDGSFKPAAAVFRDQYSGRILPSVTETRFPLTQNKQRPSGRQTTP
jgi:endo-1,4-beta-mannosidase